MTTATMTDKFQVTLHVADLARSTAFYRILLGCEPVRQSSAQAAFEIDQPPLRLTLTPGPAPRAGGSLNHLGIRMPDSAALVEVQRRLEEAGLPTQRQEGVECCYAKQTKFWVTDPDRHLWELYVFHENIEHSGFDDASHAHPWKPQVPGRVFKHLLTEPVPSGLYFLDGDLGEVFLEGTCNLPHDDAVWTSLLAEAFRTLRPGGRIVVHGMVSLKPFVGEPKFPGLAGLVRYVPTEAELSSRLRSTGFVGMFLETYKDVCLSTPENELFEIRLVAYRPATATGEVRHVVYRGPFAEVTLEAQHTFPRGECVAVDAVTWKALQQGMLADQFAFLV